MFQASLEKKDKTKINFILRLDKTMNGGQGDDDFGIDTFL